jgi:small subunit ribosomal protein S18
MAGNNDRDRGKRAIKDTRPRGLDKVCIFCQGHAQWVDYKDINLLRGFMSDRGKIRARRVTGNCAQHQREVATAIKTARELALLPYAQRTVSGRVRGGAGGGRPGAPRERAAEPVADVVPDGDHGRQLDEGDEAGVLEAIGAEA